MDRTPRRILYVGNHAGHFLTYHLPIFEALGKDGHEVHVAAPAHADHLEKLLTDDAEQSIEQLGFHFHPIPVSRRGVNLYHEFKTFITLFELYKTVKPDLVYHATIKPIIYGGFAARLARVPSVLNLVTGLGYVFIVTGIRGFLLRNLVKLAYRIAFSHPHSRTIFQNHDDFVMFTTGKVIAAEKAMVVKGMGVNVSRFHVVPEPVGLTTVTLLSRMLWDKGIAEFVNAAKQLCEEGSSAQFVLVGDSDPSNPSAIPIDQLEEWQKSGAIQWWGWRKDVIDILQKSHIVCLPSYREGVPQSLIEAAACGRPIVATDAPGCREIVLDGENGILVPPRNASALADGLRKLIQNPELRRDMGKRGREIAVAEFSVEVIVTKIIAICDELLALV